MQITNLMYHCSHDSIKCNEKEIMVIQCETGNVMNNIPQSVEEVRGMMW